jgi:hypothetical protein
MHPPPVVLGLTVCEKIIVEERTKNVTLVSTFTKLVADELPTPPQKFAIYTVLTGAHGDGIIDLEIRSLETNEEISSNQMPAHFADRLMELRILFRVASCSFPSVGHYQVTLLLDGEWLAQRRIHVVQREE